MISNSSPKKDRERPSLRKLYIKAKQTSTFNNLPKYREFEKVLRGSKKARKTFYDRVNNESSLKVPEWQSFNSRYFNEDTDGKYQFQYTSEKDEYMDKRDVINQMLSEE